MVNTNLRLRFVQFDEFESHCPRMRGLHRPKSFHSLILVTHALDLIVEPQPVLQLHSSQMTLGCVKVERQLFGTIRFCQRKASKETQEMSHQLIRK